MLNMDMKQKELPAAGRKFGWHGEFKEFVLRLMANADCIPYVVVCCDCKLPLYLCQCANVMVVPVFNASKDWLLRCKNVH